MQGQFTKSLLSFINWLYNHPAQFFVTFGIIFGIIVCFHMQPLSGADEFTHFPRAYQIESGQLWERQLPESQYGGYLPNNIVGMISNYRDLSRKPTGRDYNTQSKQLRFIYSNETKIVISKQSTAFTSDAPYPPWTYLPSVIGIFFAHLIKAPLIWYVYLARIFSLIFYVILVFLAIKLIPHGKWFIATLALLPTALTASLTIGLSALVIGTSWLIIALVFAIIANKVKLTWKMLIILTVLGFILSTLKQGYVLIAAMPLIIPLKYYSKKRNFIIWKIIFGVVLISSAITFGVFTKHIAQNIVLTPISGVNINTNQQISYILHNPLIFISHLIIQPFTKSFDTVYLGVVGIITQRLIYLSVAMIGLLYLAIFITWKDTRTIPKFVQQKYYLISSVTAIAVSTYFIIATALFIAFTQVGNGVVNGLTGTYFLPLLPLALIIPMSMSIEGSHRLERTTMLLVVFIVVLGLLSTIFSLV